MIYSCNTLGFYKTKSNRQYDNTGNVRVIHHFETDKIPAFQLVVDSTITTCTYELLDAAEGVVSSGSVTVENDTNEAGTAFSRLIRKQVALSGNSDGFYSLKVTYDGNILYSDVFCWQTDLTEHLKVYVASTDVQIGEFSMNMDGFTYEVYLDAKNAANEYEIEEAAEEKTYGLIPLFNSRNKMSEFEITGYKVTQDFLAALRVFWVNGTITLTYEGDEFEIYDMESPEKKDTFGYSANLVMTMRFKRKDYLQSLNAI